MYLNILKKDLKRKKTMNLIILLFVILAAMFFASGMNNIVSIMGGVDRFLDMAGMGDYVVFLAQPEGDTTYRDALDAADFVSGYRSDLIVTVSSEDFLFNGKKQKTFSNIGCVQTLSSSGLHLYDAENREITDVPKGKVMVTASIVRKAGLQSGDRISFTLCGETLDLEYTGIVKDAVLGAPMLENPRFVVNADDFRTLTDNAEIAANYRFGMFCISTADPQKTANLSANAQTVVFSGPRSMIKMTYILYMLVAGIIMTVSIGLILIAFVVLRFTINFTLTEEFREIGVMKAIGLKSRTVRGLYLVKYLGISLIGAAIGFFASVPFGNMLMQSVSSDIILSSRSPLLIDLFCCIAVICIIMLFCWRCTAKIRKLSPVDAVRNGQTGERFSKKSILHLSRSRFGADPFLSANDILSSPKQTGILTAVLTLCMTLVMILSTTANTLSGEGLIGLVGCTRSDAYLNLPSECMQITGGVKTRQQVISEIEAALSENGMPGTVRLEALYSVPAAFGDHSSEIRFMKCSETKAADYDYAEGTAPEYPNEIALGCPMAEELGAGIGDRITLTVNGEQDEYIVTALFDSMSQLGKCGRFHESLSIPDDQITSFMAFQIDFADHPDAQTVRTRIDRLKTLYDTDAVYDTAEYVGDCTKSAGAVNGVKALTMVIAMIAAVMMCVLIESAFISRERSEIALMKAIGFRNRSVIGIHIGRFSIISIISALLALALHLPATKLLITPILGLLGAGSGIRYEINAPETFVLIPLVMLAAILFSVWLTALRTNAVKASDISDIE